MIVEGISAKFIDKRVNRLLEKSGYVLSECSIFYSPIKAGFVYIAYFIVFLFPITLFLYTVFQPVYFIVYSLICYLFWAYLNNSFALVHQKLIVINPNFPFRKVTVFEISEIEKIRIDSSFLKMLSWLFLVLGSNYIEIFSANKSNRFYCVRLDEDFYDENLTEKNLHDFNDALKEQNIVTEFNFD